MASGIIKGVNTVVLLFGYIAMLVVPFYAIWLNLPAAEKPAVECRWDKKARKCLPESSCSGSSKKCFQK